MSAVACPQPAERAQAAGLTLNLTHYSLAACAGLLLPAWLPVLPDPLWLLISAGVSLINRRAHLMSVFLLAVAWSGWQAQQVFEAIPEAYVNQPVNLTGRVIDLPKPSGDGLLFVLQVSQPEWLRSKRIRVSWFRAQQPVNAGEQWQVEGNIRPVYGSINPQGFDYARWLLSQRISGTLSVRQANRLKAVEPYGVGVLRARIADWIRRELPAETAAAARALSIGDRGLIREEQREALLRTGTGHLLAISGLHAGLVGMLGWWLGRLMMGAGLPHRCPAGLKNGLDQAPVIFSALLAIGYSLLSGLAVSTGRALVMLLVVGLAVCLRRTASVPRLLLMALMITLLINPLAALGAGLWLSFAAVFWLWWGLHGRLRRSPWWLSLVRAQLVLMAGMLPLQLLWFQQLSVAALPANLLAVPVVSLLVLPMLLLAMILHLITVPGAEWILNGAGLVLGWLQGCLNAMADMPWSALAITPGAGYWRVLLAITGALWLLTPRGAPLRLAGLALLLPLLSAPAAGPKPGHWQMAVFDVGQGLAVAVRTRHHLLVYDTGPGDGRGRDRVRGAMLPLLRRWGATVDTLIVSHGDLDHAGGYKGLLDGLPVKNIFSSRSRLGQPCHAGQSWNWDGVRFRMLHPSEYLPYLGNDSSCVLLIESEHGSALLPGDISQAAEKRLLNLHSDLSADVLIAAHHGSKSSSSEALIKTVNPDLALVSAGRWNRFEMPHQPVVQRYSQAGIPLINTADCGALLLDTEDAGWPRSDSVRRMLRRWWQPADDCPVQPGVIE